MTIYTTVEATTVSEVFGIESIHDTIREMAEWTSDPVDLDAAESDYRVNLEAYLPIGWDIRGDTIYRWPDSYEPMNAREVRENAQLCINCFDLADYAL